MPECCGARVRFGCGPDSKPGAWYADLCASVRASYRKAVAKAIEGIGSEPAEPEHEPSPLFAAVLDGIDEISQPAQPWSAEYVDVVIVDPSTSKVSGGIANFYVPGFIPLENGRPLVLKQGERPHTIIAVLPAGEGRRKRVHVMPAMPEDSPL